MTKQAIKIPKMLDVKSSSISHVGYDAGALFVRFAAGRVYRYDGVSADQYAALRKAESIGKHLQVEILRNFTGELVPESEA